MPTFVLRTCSVAAILVCVVDGSRRTGAAGRDDRRTTEAATAGASRPPSAWPARSARPSATSYGRRRARATWASGRVGSASESYDGSPTRWRRRSLVSESELPAFYRALRGDQRAAIAADAPREPGRRLHPRRQGRAGEDAETIGYVFGREEDPEGDHLIIAPRLSPFGRRWERELRLLEEDRATALAIFVPGAIPSGPKRDAEMERWNESVAPYRFVLIIEEMLNYRDEGGERRASYPDLFRWRWNTVAVDESHRPSALSPSTKGPPLRSRAVGARRTARRSRPDVRHPVRPRRSSAGRVRLADVD